MARIPIQNETDYPLTDDMMQHILRDAHEHFGEEIRAIRVQSGMQRHALNARTREVRYAFFPQDFGVAQTTPTVHEPSDASSAIPTIDTEPEEGNIPGSFEPMEGEEEDIETLETSLESLDEGREDDDEDDDFFTLDDPVEDVDEDDEDEVFDREDEEE